jgi:hypothetical protein
MTIEDLPVVGPLLSAGTNDRIFDSLLLLGPPVIIGVGVIGRTPVTTTLVVLYLLVFVGYTALKGLYL